MKVRDAGIARNGTLATRDDPCAQHNGERNYRGEEHPESLGQSICRSRLDASGKIRGLRPS